MKCIQRLTYLITMSEQQSQPCLSSPNLPPPSLPNNNYLVNNSLPYTLQPKRAAYDLKIYLQLHRKMFRKVAIEKTFEKSMYLLGHAASTPRKGFKGKVLPQSYSRRNHYHDRDDRNTIEPDEEQESVQHRRTKNHSRPSCESVKSVQARHQTQPMSRGKGGRAVTIVKPNMMYNLSLYRKSYKRQEARQATALSMVRSQPQDLLPSKRGNSLRMLTIS